jgi:hypothetical protein
MASFGFQYRIGCVQSGVLPKVAAHRLASKALSIALPTITTSWSKLELELGNALRRGAGNVAVFSVGHPPGLYPRAPPTHPLCRFAFVSLLATFGHDLKALRRLKQQFLLHWPRNRRFGTCSTEPTIWAHSSIGSPT